jgi:hypothetical protein
MPASLLKAQSIIENPAKPHSADAGRVITLQEVLRISDREGRFFFKLPREILIGKDGCIYVLEDNQFLKFNPAGKFVANLIRWGQGPGELNDNITDALVGDKEITLFSSNLVKAVRKDLQGASLKDLTFRKPFLNLIAEYKGSLYFTQAEISAKDYKLKSGILEWNFRLVKVDASGTVIPTPTFLPLTESMMTRGGSVMIMGINKLERAQADSRHFYLNHTPEYLVKVLDLESGEIVKSFRRDYERVSFVEKSPSGSLFKTESPKYHNDICRLLLRGGKLWVVTSTFDKNKGILVDVFDREGRFVDNFFLPLPLRNIDRSYVGYDVCMAISGDFLYVIENDDDGLITLVKYEIHGA